MSALRCSGQTRCGSKGDAPPRPAGPSRATTSAGFRCLRGRARRPHRHAKSCRPRPPGGHTSVTQGLLGSALTAVPSACLARRPAPAGCWAAGDQSHCVAQLADLPAPIVRAGASLHRHNAGRLRGQEPKQPRPREALAEHTWPAASAPCAWKTCFAMSNPIVIACSMDASFR
jgi:hypothetical protein